VGLHLHILIQHSADKNRYKGIERKEDRNGGNQYRKAYRKKRRYIISSQHTLLEYDVNTIK